MGGLTMADEYISREAAIKAIEDVVAYMESWVTEYQAQRRGLMTAIVIVDDIPAADVQPVRHGRWKNIIQGIIPSGQCSNCGAWDKVTRFCPNCGADMREVNNHSKT
jgi:NADH pyrophosphatase NudC (nudix superfamily)